MCVEIEYYKRCYNRVTERRITYRGNQLINLPQRAVAIITMSHSFCTH